jgi:bile acid:Na+ symporter, BASS family
VFLLAALGYIIGYLFAKQLKQSNDNVIALTYNSGMRNISAGAVIAITYVPAPVAFPVIVCMLFQQVLASITGSILSYTLKHKNKNSLSTHL